MKMIPYGIIVLSFISAFAIIHFGVGIGIVANNRSYGDLFRPELGLGSFNIIIGFVGMIVGGLGLFSIITKEKVVGIVVAALCGILAAFALGSLIAALVLNARSATYVSGRFSTKMSLFTSDQGARNIINRIQTDYTCCGETSWLDWSRYQSATPTTTTPDTTPSAPDTTPSAPDTTPSPSAPNTTPSPSAPDTTPSPSAPNTTPSPSAPDTTPSPSAPNTTPSPSAPNTTPSPSAPDTTPSPSAPDTTPSPSVPDTTPSPSAPDSTPSPSAPDTTPTPGDDTTAAPSPEPSSRLSRAIRRIRSYILVQSPLVLAIRRKRQTGSTDNNVISVPFSTTVSVPRTCCNSARNGSNNPSPSTCTSANNFYTDGCLKFMIRRANKQEMGIGVINCFMLVLALVAIPLLIRRQSTSNVPGKKSFGQQLGSMNRPATTLPRDESFVDTYH